MSNEKNQINQVYYSIALAKDSWGGGISAKGGQANPRIKFA